MSPIDEPDWDSYLTSMKPACNDGTHQHFMMFRSSGHDTGPIERSGEPQVVVDLRLRRIEDREELLVFKWLSWPSDWPREWQSKIAYLILPDAADKMGWFNVGQPLK